MYARYHDQGFDIVGVSIDSDLDAVRKYVEAEGIGWTNLCGLGREQPTVVRYSIHSFPYHVLVDRDGIVAALDPEWEALPSVLERLVAQQGR